MQLLKYPQLILAPWRVQIATGDDGQQNARRLKLGADTCRGGVAASQLLVIQPDAVSSVLAREFAAQVLAYAVDKGADPTGIALVEGLVIGPAIR